jgi:hypothetical protein
MKQKDFFENFFTSGFGEIMFHFLCNNIKVGAFWCQSNLDTVFGVQSISLLFLCSFKMKVIFNYLIDYRKWMEQGES